MWVHATVVKRGRAVAHCCLEELQTSRVLEVPLWMLDVAACCKTRVAHPGFAGAQSLRELKEVLQSAHLRPTNKSYRIDETYIRIKGQDRYLYRAVDSTGQTIEFLLTAKRDAAAAKRFLVKAIEASGNAMPRVMNVDKNPAYPAAIEALKAESALPRRVRLRQCKYLNNVIEQDHRIVKKRVWLAKGYGSFQSAWRTLQGIETVHMIRKGE